jgi:hypothetical protein
MTALECYGCNSAVPPAQEALGCALLLPRVDLWSAAACGVVSEVTQALLLHLVEQLVNVPYT